MFSKVDKNAIRQKRHQRIRNHLAGTATAPRLNVYRSTVHIYAQVIDDNDGKTIVAASTVEKELAAKVAGKTKVEQATIIGEEIAKRAIEKGVENVVFDRGGYLYTGRVAALADGARKGGLKF